MVSLDAINDERRLSGGEGMTVAQCEQTSMIAVERLVALMTGGCSAIVIDDTLSHRFLRDRYRRVAADYGYACIVAHVDTPLHVIEARRRTNDSALTRHRVRDPVFAKHCDEFQQSDKDEPVVPLHSPAEIDRWLESL